MSRLLANTEMRWFIGSFILTTTILGAAFFLKAASEPAKSTSTRTDSVHASHDFKE